MLRAVLLQRQLSLPNQYWKSFLVTTTTRSFAKLNPAASAKKKKQAAATPSTVPADTGRDKNLELILASLDAPMRVEPEVSAEEKARRYEIGRNYVIGRFREHNEINHDLACKIQLKKHCIKMLPRNNPKLKEEALKIDGDGPPPWRLIAKWTPPIPGFDPTPFLDKEE